MTPGDACCPLRSRKVPRRSRRRAAARRTATTRRGGWVKDGADIRRGGRLDATGRLLLRVRSIRSRCIRAVKIAHYLVCNVQHVRRGAWRKHGLVHGMTRQIARDRAQRGPLRRRGQSDRGSNHRHRPPASLAGLSAPCASRQLAVNGGQTLRQRENTVAGRRGARRDDSRRKVCDRSVTTDGTSWHLAGRRTRATSTFALRIQWARGDLNPHNLSVTGT